MPSDIDPQSGFRLPLPKREDLDEAGRRALDRAAVPGATPRRAAGAVRSSISTAGATST